MKDIIYFQSNKGIKFRKIAVIFTIIFVFILLVVSLIEFINGDGNSTDWEFYLFISANVLLLGILANYIAPNTYSVSVKETGIQVNSGKISEIIPYSNIKSITPSISFLGSKFKHYEFFKVDFVQKTAFGNTIRYYESSKYRNESNNIYKHIKMKIAENYYN